MTLSAAQTVEILRVTERQGSMSIIFTDHEMNIARQVARYIGRKI